MQIDDSLASVVVAQLLWLEAASKAPISVYINSPGGAVTAGLAIYDTVSSLSFIRKLPRCSWAEPDGRESVADEVRAE